MRDITPNASHQALNRDSAETAVAIEDAIDLTLELRTYSFNEPQAAMTAAWGDEREPTRAARRRVLSMKAGANGASGSVSQVALGDSAGYQCRFEMMQPKTTGFLGPMKRVTYILSVKSGGWSHHPAAHHPEYRLLNFLLVASRGGKRLGGHNVQAVVGAPDQPRYGLDEDVAIWLPSDWWVSLRNEFAKAPDVATEILTSVGDQLDEITAQLSDARGERTEQLTEALFGTVFHAQGPDHWR